MADITSALVSALPLPTWTPPTWTPPTAVYTVGKELELFPFSPGPPHGTTDYGRRPLPATLEAGHIRDFDTDEAKYIKTKTTVKIDEVIRVDADRQSQIVRCKVLHAPMESRLNTYPLTMSLKNKNKKKVPIARSLTLTLKAYDYEYYPGCVGAPWGNGEEADANFSREFAFYGGWVMKIESKDKDGNLKPRYVSLLLTEYLYGYSIENLCYRKTNGDPNSRGGEVTPDPYPVPFSKATGGVTDVKFDEEM
ncbi:hypothetical protein CMUS01_16536 [Colletotrichum musicola]|uniref:Uncharacterized protein n=1 Tax=Colletotrichum musicola TaxID=2175873 RepID=A0A8H6IN16_9PEZI|nr:hypothetical protein CMUS01_16536 [Colletotrichum musicola]